MHEPTAQQPAQTAAPDEAAIAAIAALPHAERLRRTFARNTKPLSFDEIVHEVAHGELRLSHVVDWLTAARRAGLIDTIACEDPYAGRRAARNSYRLSAQGRARWARDTAPPAP
jgi:hypothetical protein